VYVDRRVVLRAPARRSQAGQGRYMRVAGQMVAAGEGWQDSERAELAQAGRRCGSVRREGRREWRQAGGGGVPAAYRCADSRVRVRAAVRAGGAAPPFHSSILMRMILKSRDSIIYER